MNGLSLMGKPKDKPVTTKNEARELIARLNFPEENSKVNFEQLDNDQYLSLYQALRRLQL